MLFFSSAALGQHDTLFNRPNPVDVSERTKVLSKFFSPGPLNSNGNATENDLNSEGPAIPATQYKNLIKDDDSENLKKFHMREIAQKCKKTSADLEATEKCIEVASASYLKSKVTAEPKKGELDAKDVLESSKKSSEIGTLKGSIKVTPPKGRCLTITKNKETRDIRVCKATDVEFQLNEISIGGILTWMVSTGADDTGTPIHWQTPHRIALVIGVEDGPKADSSQVFINSCAAYNDDGGRRVHLKLFNNVVWVIRFPDNDILLPQPPPPPNLYVHFKNELNMAEKSTKQKPGPPKSDEHKKEEPKPNPESKAEPVKPTPDKSDKAPLPYGWTMTSLNTYTMSSAFFMPDGASTPGIPGKCRYRFTDPEQVPAGGTIECQNSPGYAYALIPMACSAAFAK